MQQRKNTLVLGLYILFTSTLLRADPEDAYATNVYDSHHKTPFQAHYPLPHTDRSLLAHLPVQTSTMPGSLEPASLSIRGFSGERTTILLDQLDLSDPAFGFFDPTDLPVVFRSATLETTSYLGLGSALRFELPLPTDNWALSQMEMGSFGYSAAELSQQAALTPDTHALTAIRFSKSKGDFSYLSEGVPVVRQNNDQNRLQTIGRLHIGKLQQGISALFIARLHEGGIAGSLFYNTPHLRMHNTYLGASLKGLFPFASLMFTPEWATRLENRQTNDQNQSWQTKSMAHRLQLRMQSPLGIPDSLFQATAFGDYAHIIDSPFNQAQIQGTLKFEYIWRQSPFKPFLSLEASQSVHSHFSPSPTGVFQMGFSPLHLWQIGFQLSKTKRNPTLIELYAPFGFTKANPSLLPEFLLEAELRSTWNTPISTLQLSVFSGSLADSIVYDLADSQNINAGRLQRFGIESHVRLIPTAWLQMELSEQWLHTHMEFFNAPLPKPPLQIQANVSVGDQKHLSAYLQGHYQSAFTNFFSKHTHTNTLALGAGLRFSLLKGIQATLSATNILDTQAMDTMENPLAGRAFWLSLDFSDEQT